MKTKFFQWFTVMTWLAFSTLNLQLSTLQAQGTAFTYQGRLNNGASAATGLYDFQFALSNAPSGGSQIGSTVTNLGVGVTNGLFTTTLNFSNVFNGQSAWLAISVRTNGAGSYIGLTPLQSITPTPYAIYAETANATNLIGSVQSGNVSGVALLTGGNALSGNQTINSGSVGIGTTTPAAALEVSSPNSPTIKLSGPGGTLTQVRSTTGGQGWDLYIGTNNYAISRNGVDFPFIIDATTGNSLFINRVGIGTTTPTSALQVNGTVVANSFSGNGSGLTGLSGANVSGVALLAGGNTFSGTQIFTSGNVGIGTTTPANKFEVSGSADFTGFVGIGTNNPTARLTLGGETSQFPTALLIQPTGYSGPSRRASLALDNWSLVKDVNGNGAKDFAIYDGATFAQRLYIGTNGNVGLGTISPANKLDVAGSADVTGNLGVGTTAPNTEKLVVAGGADLTTAASNAGNDSGLGLSFESYGGRIQSFQNRPLILNSLGNNVGIGTTNPATSLDVKGEITCVALNVTSDRNAKEDFQVLNPRDVLDKVAALSITEWQYKAEKDKDTAAARHIGPMAQDFSAAFALSQDDKHISVVDEGGVALAAIQGLNEKLEETRSENAELKQTVSELKQLVQQLQRNLPVSDAK